MSDQDSIKKSYSNKNFANKKTKDKKWICKKIGIVKSVNCKMMIIYASDEEEDGDEPSNKMVSSSMS